MTTQTAMPAPPTAFTEPQAFDMPAAALRFDRAAFQFAKNDKPADPKPNASGRPEPVPFSMLARTGDPITHWYWGSIVHDMAGFTPRKDTVCIDYCHDPQSILGYADKQVATDEGLTLSGMLTPFSNDDRASEIIFKAANGVPYESSIEFDYSSVEFLQDKAAAQVNGKTFTGPGYIVRQWTIKGTAVCPYGADGKTSTTFAADDPLKTRSATLFSKEDTMTTKVTEGGTEPAPDAKPTPAPTTELTAADHKASLTAGLKKFTTKFGAENGVTWFTEGKTYEEALELHIAAQTETNKKLTADLEAANTKLANAPQGEAAPVSTSDAEKGAKSLATTAPNVSGIAKFAAGLKMPAGTASAKK